MILNFKKLLLRYCPIFINTILYFIGILVLKGASFFMLPLYTRYLSVAEYGDLEFINTLIASLSIMVSAGLNQYISVDFFRNQGEARLDSIKNIISIYLVQAIPFSFIIIFVLYYTIDLEFGAVLIIVLTIFITFFSNISSVILKNTQKIFALTTIQVISGVSALILNYVTLVILSRRIAGVLFSSFISIFLMCVLPFALLCYHLLYLKQLRLKKVLSLPIPNNAIGILKISIPFALTSVVSWVLVSGDRFILKLFSPESALGIYSLAYKFGSIFDIVVVSTMSVILAPIVYRKFQEEGLAEGLRQQSKILRVYLVISGIVCAAILVGTHVAFLWFIDAGYAEAKNYVWLILLGYIFLGGSYINSYAVNYLKKSKQMLVVYLISSLLNIVLNLLLVPFFHVVGAAATTTISYFILFILTLILKYKIASQYR